MEEKDLNLPENEGSHQAELNESNAARRMRLLGMDQGDKIHDESVIIKKGNFFSNFWYQHKWGVIIGVAFLFIAIFFIVSIASQPSYDMYIAYAGPLYPNYETHGAIEKAFTDMSKDYNKDGEKLLNFAAITYQNEEQRKQTAEEMLDTYGIVQHTNENYKALTSIQSQMMSGTVAIYLMDEALYKQYEAGMVKISDIIGTDVKLGKEALAGDSGVYFKKTDFYYHMFATEWGKALRNLPDDTVLCILPKLVTIDEEMYESSVSLIKSILEFSISK